MRSSRRNLRRALDTPSGRLIIGALLAVAIGVVIGWMLFRDDGAPAPPQATTPLTTTGAGAPARFSQFGLRFQRPAGWTSTIEQGVLNVSAPDKSVSVAVAMPPGKPDVKGLRGSDREELAKLFDAREVGRRRYAVGPLPTLVTELLGRTEAGREIRILSMGVSSRWRTYSVSIFSAPQAQQGRALELQTLIASFEFRKPR